MNGQFSLSKPTKVTVPLGGRVLIKSNLDLSREPSPSSEPALDQFLSELSRFEGPGVVIVAGGLFASSDEARHGSTVFNHHGQFGLAITSFLSQAGRQFIVLPGEKNATLADPTESGFLTDLGVTIAESVELHAHCATGVQKVIVTTQSPLDGDVGGVTENRTWLEGITHLESPGMMRRFISSRILYRRLRNFLWVPPVVALVVALFIHFTLVSRQLNRIENARTHRFIFRFVDAPWHLRFLWVLVAVIIIEAILGVLVTVIARRLFSKRSNGSPENKRGRISQETPAAFLGASPEALELARSLLADGVTGVVIGGLATASLTHLDAGFLAVPGSSSLLVREHFGRLGLPPVFLEHLRNGEITLEVGAQIYAHLGLSDRRLHTDGWLERLVAGRCATPTPPESTGHQEVAEWPLGGAWPPATNLPSTQNTARRVRRIGGISLFLTGFLDLLIAVSPPLRQRFHHILSYLPLGISQTATVAIVAIGIALVMLSRGIFRGQRRSWFVAVVLLATSTALHIAHNANIGAVLISLVVLIFLLTQRRWFQGTTDRESLKGALPILMLILLVAIVSSFVGVELTNIHKGQLPSWPLVLLAVTERLIGLSTQALPDRVEDFVYPAMFTVGITVGISILYLITRPVVDRRRTELAGTDIRERAQQRARDIVLRHGKGTLDYFALRDDKEYFFYGDSVVAYAVFGGIALVSPDPIGPESERTQVWAAFRAYCDVHGWGPGVIGGGEAWLPIYDESGMRYIYLGDEAVIDVPNFSLEGKKMKGLRQACTRLERNGYTVEFLDPSMIDPARVPGLVELMKKNRRGEEERGFSMMLGRLFDPRDTGLLLTIISGPDGEPAAMCQFVPSSAINGYSLDLLRRDPGEHPNGLLDYALCSTIAHLKERNVTGLSLNFSAFRSTLDGEKGNGLTQRVERWGLRRLSSILPIETLWKFNEKYHPNWLARHLVFASPEYFVPTVAAALRAEALTELPVVGRFMMQDVASRAGTIVPEELLAGLPVSQPDGLSR
jgi:lysylphosphatidylglycerol synthetase-like protein (DUF2156 family)